MIRAYYGGNYQNAVENLCNVAAFSDAVASAVTKGAVDRYTDWGISDEKIYGD